MPDTNPELLDRAVAGDGEALAQLLEENATAVRGAIAARIPQRWQSVLSIDDVMQETYVDAFLDIGRFDPRGGGAFTGWLITLARRNLLDGLRMLEAAKRGRNHRRIHPATATGSLMTLYDQLTQPDTTPSRSVARAEAHVSLRTAIQRLPNSYRTIVELFDLGGNPAEDVAATLGITVGAVYMRRARAHRQLGELLGAPSQYLSGGG